MLRTIRVTLATLLFLSVTLLFLDFTGTAHLWLGWTAKLQFMPAVLAHSAILIGAIVVGTLLLGRVYCSVVCPLGVAQDVVSHVAGRRRKNRFRYSRPRTWLRYVLMALFVVALVAGIGAVVSLLDPYSAWGRIAENLLAPLYRLANNGLAWLAARADSYAFYSTDVWVKSGLTLVVAVVTLLVVGVLSWRGGRTYCNTICPVGSILGLLSRFSLLRVRIDRSKCTRCGLCEKNCKSSCIDSKNMSVDGSRCVACFDCLNKCRFDAIAYTARRTKSSPRPAPEQDKEGSGMSRRSFLMIAGALVAARTVKAQQLHVDGGLAEIEDKKIPVRNEPVIPPGARGARNLKRHCTACQLCVSSCPNGILRPSTAIATLMQPEMSFERGYCRPECVECSSVCPAGAIDRITVAEKSAISIGHAVWLADNCVVGRDKLPCNACQRHCPTGAITLVPGAYGEKLPTPVVDNSLCIGCGACEYYCPARPFSAICVEGNVVHHNV